MKNQELLEASTHARTYYHFGQTHTSAGLITFDVAIASSELHTFIIICDRPDQEQPAARFSNECVEHILDCDVYLVEDALRRKTAVFTYYDPVGDTMYRLNASISDDHSVSTYWEPTDPSLLRRLKLPEYKMASQDELFGCFSNFDA